MQEKRNDGGRRRCGAGGWQHGRGGEWGGRAGGGGGRGHLRQRRHGREGGQMSRRSGGQGEREDDDYVATRHLLKNYFRGFFCKGSLVAHAKMLAFFGQILEKTKRKEKKFEFFSEDMRSFLVFVYDYRFGSLTSRSKQIDG